MGSQRDLPIEDMTAKEIRKVIEDLNDRNQMLENHLNIMKKCFQSVIKFHSFLEQICNKYKDFVTESESKQLSEFQKQFSDMCQGRIPTHILVDAMASRETTDVVEWPLEITEFGSASNSEISLGDKFGERHVCPLNRCRRWFKTKTELNKHIEKCPSSSKRSETVVSYNATEAESGHSEDIMVSKAITNDKQMKIKAKKNHTITSCSQTPFSSALTSSNVKSGLKPKAVNKSRVKRRKSQSTDNIEDMHQKSATNEELIVSHNTDSNGSFGEWMDTNNDSYFKCSETSCGQLFPENSDLLRHKEINHSSDFESDTNEDHFHLKTEPNLFEEFEIREEFDGSNQLLSIDHIEGQNRSMDSPFSLVSDSKPVPQNLLNDKNYNSSKSLLKCSEEFCEMTFEEDMDLIIHLKAVHNKKVKKCTFTDCSFLYENRNLLWAHLKERHKGEQMPFKCSHSQCSNAFLTEADLNRHITSFHAIDRHSNISGIFVSDTLSNCQSVKRRKT